MKVITFRADDELVKYIDLICQQTNKRKSDVIRDLIIKGNVHNETNKIELSYELNRIGNNFNQITKHCNIKKAVDIAVLQELKVIEEMLQELIKNDM